jgi:pyruvate dehydrogenase E1 component alpha subunit
MYRTMVLIRTQEERLLELYLQGKIVGNYHSRMGEEGAAVGVCFCLRNCDYLVPALSKPFAVTKGLDLKRFVAELLYRKTGLFRGVGGEAHYADLNARVIGRNGIVGENIPIAVGLALAAKLKAEGEIVVCNFGNGAAARGVFHESLNLAAIWNLPLVFACSNNQWAVGIPQNQCMKMKKISDMAKTYCVPGFTVDGSDVLAVYQAATKAVERARKGKGPTLLEIEVPRLKGHHTGDPQTYRSREDIEEHKKRDPMPLFRAKLLKMNVLNEDKAQEIEKEAATEVDKAIDFALKSPHPSRDDVLTSVYARI